MYSRRIALANAKQYRTCPPPEIVRDPIHHREFEKHKAICPYCSEEGLKDSKTWADFVAKLTELHEPSEPYQKDDSFLEGQFRPVRESFTGWRNGFYYNPPLVLILETPENLLNAVNVAQTYHDISLAGPGDLILTEERLSIGPLFVEAWNAYTLKTDRLGPVVGKVTSDIIDAVKRLQKDPSAYSEWAMHPRPIIEHDPRVYFRELEVETGYTFSAKAVAEIVSEMESEATVRDYESIEELRARVVSIAGGVKWFHEPKTLQDVLVLARLPETHFKLAASDSERRYAYANLGVFLQGELKDLRPVRMRIHGEGKDEQGHYTVDGQVEDLPEGVVDSQFYCYLE
ncbi:MAG: hypothetical protein ABII26_12490, partial [Pseudomonadota bacterium]